MDLRERSETDGVRHPWETARLHVVERLLATRLRAASRLRVLDLGCGDGYVITELSARFGFTDVTACDIELSPADLSRLRQASPHIAFTNERSSVAGRFDLILLLDVVEHVADDSAWLRDIAERHLTADGQLLITVPAFQSLFNRHDRYLKHFRRYRRGELRAAVARAGLRAGASGYFFTSLLAPRALSKLLEVLLPARVPVASGVGHWQRGPWLSRSLATWLVADARLCLGAARVGVVLPGLSCWLLCKK